MVKEAALAMKQPEEDEEDEEMEGGEEEETADASILEPVEGEDEGGEELDLQGEEQHFSL